MREVGLIILIYFIGKVLTGNGDCVEPCIVRMQKTLEMTPILANDNLGHLSLGQLAGNSEKATQQSFNSICTAYREVDKCLERCEGTSENSARVRQTYAGIRFICVEHSQEFFASLPCLAREEPKAMASCKSEINSSLEASNRFSKAVVNREQHSIRQRFESLCKQLGAMIDCVEPVTRKGCGDDAAWMMLRFITVGFSSFEQLYSQLGISDQLPASCRSLLNLRHNPMERHPTNPRSLLSRSTADLSAKIPSFSIFFLISLFLF
ncbi:unnamed protein product, partial [Mesorhabditis belari]|uniref:Chondroitin proteoglycan 4 domain-containing protein n=1 Tax=Mesorhabditis belari TaxID=2138241 RepID=A0AAF3EEZ8_9BILA